MRFFFIILFFLSQIVAHTQSRSLSLELQAYPTGFISGITYEHYLGSSSSLSFRLGANPFDHRDLGVHDGEEGRGFGGSIGYKKYLRTDRMKWFWSIRSDVWKNEVDWFDIEASNDRITGTTSILVLQPTVSLGYSLITLQHIYISPSLSFGYEWNVKTEGQPTGEGSIILLGISIGKRF